MSKYRVYELAKEFGTTSKLILDILSRNQNDTAKNHMSCVGDPERDIIVRTFTPASNRPTPEKTGIRPTVQNQPPVKMVQENVQTSVPGKSAPNMPNSSAERVEMGNVRPNVNGNPRPVQGQNINQNPRSAQSQNVHQNFRTAQGQNANRDFRPVQGQNTNRDSRPVQGQNINRDARPPQRPNMNQNARPAQGQNMNQNFRPAQGQNANQNARPVQGQNMNQNFRPAQGSNTNQNFRPAQGQNANQGARPVQGQNANPKFRSPIKPGTAQDGRGPVSAGTAAKPRTTGAAPGGPGGVNRSQGNRGNAQNNARKGAFGQARGSSRNKNNRRNPNAPQQVKPQRPEMEKPKLIQLGASITIKDFAAKIGYEVSEIIKKLMMLGVMATINQEIDFDTATLIAGEFEVTVEELPPEADPTEIPEIVDDPSLLVHRPPVVTVMGHVDHGKTSLLDVIRKTQVTAKEAGGITQHIGAYQVVCQNKKIVFLDTPGHEAFTAMRARGAQVTDIAILVVAADDGVMPQTVEAINHAKSANVPIIVAINKIDRPGANPEHVKQQLSEHGLIPEDWGGDTVMAPVSARQRLGINELLEMVLLVAEMQELKANPNRAAQGIIIEAQLDKGRGPVSTVLVQTGTLQIGDSIIAGTAHGKVRAMINDRGEKVKKAGPSTPVEVLGLTDVPQAGDILAVLDEKVVRSIVEKRIAKRRSDEMVQSQKVSLDDLFQQIKDGDIKDLNILIKADVQGSVEALRSSLLALNTGTEVRVSVIHAGAGAVNESDVMLAAAANALIIAFNVRPDANARKLADTENIDIRTYRVIYEAINDVEAAMTGMLAPQYKEVIQGKAEIRQVMNFSKALVAGSYVLEGKVLNSSSIRIIRDGTIVHEGVIESLRRFKDDVKEVAATFECGITIEKFRDIKEGDIIEAFTMEQIKPGTATNG